MELRKLKALLSALQAAGVTSYQEGDLKLEFGPTLAPAPTGDIDIPEADASWQTGAPMALADAVARIQKAYATKPQKGRA